MKEFLNIFAEVITEQVMKPVSWCIENTDVAGASVLALFAVGAVVALIATKLNK